MRMLTATAAVVLLAALGRVARAAPEMQAADCPFTLRIGGELVAPSDAPDRDRYIVSCGSLAQRQQLQEAMSASPALDPSDAQALAPLTDSMPLLVGNLSREALLWLCGNSAAASCVRYVERDEQVSVA